MTNDQLEFAISQYLDGNLPPLEASALEERFATDAQAREAFAEYQRLDVAMKQSRFINAAPAMDWERLQAELSKSLEDAEAPVKHYSMKWLTWGAGLAVAAAVAVVVSLGIKFAQPQPGNSSVSIGNSTPAPSAAVAVLSVIGPQAEVAKVVSTAQVSIGPASETVARNWAYNETILFRPPRIVIASDINSGQDSRDSGALY